MSPTEIWVIILIVIMCVQHMLITNPGRTREDMYKSWSIYRFNVWLTYFIVILLIAMNIFAIHVADDEELRKQIANLLQIGNQSKIVVIITAFFFAIAVLIAGDLFENKLIGPFARLRDFWLIWFVSLAVFVALIENWLKGEIYNQPGQSGEVLPAALAPLFPEAPEKLLATGILIFATVTYALWIYNVLHRQITKGDGFRGRVLSYILNPAIRVVPVQAMVIGPRRSGKSELIAQCDLNFRDKINKPGKEHRGTQIIEEGRFTYEMKVREPRQFLGKTFDLGKRLQWVTMVDMPGENLGDHVALPYEIRTDVLVMVIRTNALLNSEDVIKEISNWGLESFDRCCAPLPKGAKTAEARGAAVNPANLDGQRTGDYIKALRLAIKRDEYHLPPEGRYTIGAFVLVLNAGNDPREHEKLDWIGDKHVQKLATEIGERFGIRAVFCHGHRGSVQFQPQSIFIDAVQRLLYPKVVSQSPVEAAEAVPLPPGAEEANPGSD